MKEKIKKLFDTKTKHGRIMRIILVLFVLFFVCLIGYFILRATGLWQKVNSVEKIKKIVEKGGAFSFVIFILFQILQTTVLQIPAIFVTIAGALIFGRWPAFLMSYFAVMLGSIIMFWIGRKAGRPFLYWLIGKDTAETWIKKMGGGKYLFFLMMLFPCFPDDILCCVAGLTNMSFPFFFWTNILARGLGIACTVFFGSGAVIPFHGWGLIVWGVIIVVMAILFFLSIRFKEKIDEIINQIFYKKQKPSPKLKEASNNKPSTDETQKENKPMPKLELNNKHTKETQKENANLKTNKKQGQ